VVVTKLDRHTFLIVTECLEVSFQGAMISPFEMDGGGIELYPSIDTYDYHTIVPASHAAEFKAAFLAVGGKL
jgi:hypothetical protein